MSLTRIVKTLNEKGVPGAIRAAKGWSPATISRILDNEKYAGRWIWNRTESRRDPKTGRRRRFEKPESEWVVREDEDLRIVPAQLWKAVRERRKQMHRTWPGGSGKRGFSGDQGSRQKHFPTHLLAGQHGLQLLWRHDRPGQRQERRLLRLPRCHQGRMRQQDTRAEDARREGDPRGNQAADLVA
jgi:Recombinase